MAPIIAQNGLFWPFIICNDPVITTPTTVLAATKASMFARQAATTVMVTTDRSNGSGQDTLTGGAIAGIVIGSVIGVLLLIWMIRSCFELEAQPPERDGFYHDVEPKRYRRRSRHHSHPRTYYHKSEVSMPAPVIVTDTGRAGNCQKQPTYYYSDDRTGRRFKRTY